MTKRSKPRCGKGQSCGYGCIDPKDTCREQVDEEVANWLLGVTRTAVQPADAPGKTFEQVMAQFPAQVLAKAHAKGVAEQDLGQGAKLTTKVATGLDGSTILYGFVTDADGKKYTISDGLIKEVTAAKAGAEWDEAFYAAVRAKVSGISVTETRTSTAANDAAGEAVDKILSFQPARYGNIDVSWTSEWKSPEAKKLAYYQSAVISIWRPKAKDFDFPVKQVAEPGDAGQNTLIKGRKYDSLSDEVKRIAETTPERVMLINTAIRALDYMQPGMPDSDWEGTKKRHLTATDRLFKLDDSTYDRKPTLSVDEAKSQLETEAVEWAKSRGFEPGPVNGFTAEQTAAHDVAHPATHRLIGLNSEQIHAEFGSLQTADGKPSLIAEEALVNAVEHLSRGDSLEASIQNGLRLARVQSRTGTDKERAYVRTPEFANKVIDLILIVRF